MLQLFKMPENDSFINIHGYYHVS